MLVASWRWQTLSNKQMAVDFVLLEQRLSKLDLLFKLMFGDSYWQIEYESSRLAQLAAACIIAIPIANGYSLKTTLDNLESLNLPLRTGVLIVLG